MAGRTTADTVRWLRRSYRIGAVVDAVAMLEMLFPERLDTLGRFRTGLRPDRPEFRYSMRSAAALMAGWTGLLLWAERDPLARKDVLLLTMAPVIIGLLANDASAVRGRWLSAARVAPVRALQLSLLALFGASYLRTLRWNGHPGNGGLPRRWWRGPVAGAL